MTSEARQPARPARLGLWLRALRAPFLTASGIPVLVGASAAFWKTGDFDPMRLALALGGVLALHLGANLANDYFDWRTGCDQINPEPTPFSGGSRVIQEGLISSATILVVSCLFFGLGAVLGLVLNTMVAGNGVLWLGVAGIAGGFAYSAAPFKLSYRGIGEPVVFALFGPLAVAGSYLVQTGTLSGFALLVSLPSGLLVLAILLVNEVLDVKWDREAHKRTLVVALGERRGYFLFLAAYLAAYASLAVGLLMKVFPPAAGLGFLPVVVWAKALLPRNALSDRAHTVGASRAAVLSHTASGIAIAIAYFV